MVVFAKRFGMIKSWFGLIKPLSGIGVGEVTSSLSTPNRTEIAWSVSPAWE